MLPSGTRVVVVNWRDPWHSLAGGSERYAWEIARAMRDAGASVEFWTARDAHQARHESVERIEIRRRGGTYGFYPAVWTRLLRRRWSRSPLDLVVDAENGIPVFAPVLAGHRTRVVLVMHHVHQEQFRTYFRRPASDLGRFLERCAMPVVYRHTPTVAVSESTLNEMHRQLRWRRPVLIVPNGADPPVTITREDRPDRLLVLGRLATHKRIDLVIRAVAELRTERPALRLDVVGRGPELVRLEGLVAARGLGDLVRLHGFLPDERKHALLSAARLHICASDAEGWGQVVVEAASYGLPTLARDVPGLRDSIRDGDTGWLIEDSLHDEDELVHRLVIGIRSALAELDDDERRSRMAQSCRERAEGFTWAAMHRGVQQLAEEELSRRTR